MNVVKSLRRKWSNYCKPKNRRHTCPPVSSRICKMCVGVVAVETMIPVEKIEEVVASTFIKSIEK